MPDSSTYEVRCERCRTSFAAGTQQCIHCGAPLGRRLLSFDGLAPATGAPQAGGAPAEPNAPDAQPAFARMLRFAMIGLIVVTAIVRACTERG
jgi:ribosomal protein L37E